VKSFHRVVVLLITAICYFAMFGSSAQSYAKPYDENQDPRADIKEAISLAQKENKNILIQFGGNWCPWCLRFHALVSGMNRIDSVMKANYVYLLLNVPREKEMRDFSLFREYEYPNRFGYPVFIILDKTGKRLNTQDSEAFEYFNPKISGYDTAKVLRFLTMWTPMALDPKNYSK